MKMRVVLFLKIIKSDSKEPLDYILKSRFIAEMTRRIELLKHEWLERYLVSWILRAMGNILNTL